MLQTRLDAWQPGGFKVHNRGVGGDTTARAFDRLEDDVLPLLPGVLLVQFGFNDANVRDWARVPRVSLPEFEKNLREFYRIAAARGARCVFIVNHTIGAADGKQGNALSYKDNMEPYNIAIGEVAKSCNAEVIDLPALMRQRQIALELFVVDDGLHLSALGNQLYAELLFGALREMLMSDGDKLSRPATNSNISVGDLG